MKRDIKFRGWSLSEKRWVYGYLVQGYEGVYIVYKAYDEDYKYAFENVFISVEPDSVGEFTCLKDGQDTEIYEGDILHFKTQRKFGFPTDGHDVYLTVYNSEFNLTDNSLYQSLGFYCENKMGHKTSIKYQLSHGASVIGNVHQNIDLI